MFTVRIIDHKQGVFFNVTVDGVTSKKHARIVARRAYPQHRFSVGRAWPK